MKKYLLILIILFSIHNLTNVFLFSQTVGDIKIIVNSSNPVSSLTKAKIAKLFLKKVTKWDHGFEVLPVDQIKSSTIRATFSREILGKSVSVTMTYWQQELFSGRGVPPLVKTSDNDVIAYVKANPRAIGYISASASTEGVKVLKITE